MIQEPTVTDFFKSQERARYQLIPEQFLPLRTLLEDHSAPVHPLAAEIARPILEAESKRSQNLECNYENARLWRVIAAAIKQMTPQIDRLVEVVVALSQVQDPTGFMASGQDMREEWNEFAMIFQIPRSDDPNRAEMRKEYININAFNAKLSALNVEQLDQRSRSALIFNRALEETPWEVHHVKWIEDDMADDDPEDPDIIAWRDEMLERRDIRTLNYWVPAAAVWIKYDGRGIYGLDRPIPNDEIHDEPTTWSGPQGFSKARFHHWRERFAWVSQVTALDHDTRRRAAEAAEIMKHIEEEG